MNEALGEREISASASSRSTPTRARHRPSFVARPPERARSTSDLRALGAARGRFGAHGDRVDRRRPSRSPGSPPARWRAPEPTVAAARRHRPRRHQDRGDRRPTPRTTCWAARATRRRPRAARPTSPNAMAAALTEAAKAAGIEPSELRGVGVGSPGTVDAEAGTVSHADNLPGWDASFPLGSAAALRARHAGRARQRRQRRDQRRVRARRRPALPLAARRLLGHRRRRRADPRRQALARPRRRRRDRPHRRARERPALPLRPPRLPRGLRRARRDGGAGAAAPRGGHADAASSSWPPSTAATA